MKSNRINCSLNIRVNSKLLNQSDCLEFVLNNAYNRMKHVLSSISFVYFVFGFDFQVLSVTQSNCFVDLACNLTICMPNFNFRTKLTVD